MKKPGLRPKSSKNPSFLSHEFIIQNHADIISCFAMLFIVGLMFQVSFLFLAGLCHVIANSLQNIHSIYGYFQVSSSVCSKFVTLQHNVTLNGNSELCKCRCDTCTFHSKWPFSFVTVCNNCFVNYVLTVDTGSDLQMYKVGVFDACTVFFYFLIAVVIHAVIQEYVVDVSSHQRVRCSEV